MTNEYLVSRTTEQLKAELRILGEELDNLQATPINKMDYETSTYLAATYESYDLIDQELDRRALEQIETPAKAGEQFKQVS